MKVYLNGICYKSGLSPAEAIAICAELIPKHKSVALADDYDNILARWRNGDAIKGPDWQAI